MKKYFIIISTITFACLFAAVIAAIAVIGWREDGWLFVAAMMTAIWGGIFFACLDADSND